MNLKKSNYFIKKGYKSRLKNQYFVDTTTKNLIFQPEVYQLADFLAERSEATHIIDIGAGNGLKLMQLAKKYKIIAIDHKSNMDDLRRNLPGHQAIERDLLKGLPSISNEILKRSVVISGDVIEHLPRPEKYLKDLAKISSIAPFVLISTPDRVKVRGIGDFGPPDNQAHVREWTLEELSTLLQNCKFAGHTAGYTINTNIHRRKSTSLIVAGMDSYPDQRTKVPLKKIQAIMTLHNEADVIDQTVMHLLMQGIDVHVIDNWSEDGSYEIVKKLSKVHDRLSFERFPAKKPKYYKWGNLLDRVTEVASRGSYDWYIHHDADELRVSPWLGINLQLAISFVDSRGYNAIDFTVIDFRPTEEGFNKSKKLEEFFTFCEFGKRPGHFQQVKAWKSNQESFNLSSSGGHEASFSNRRIYPLKFITKHYPLRSSAQAKQKIFSDRIPRIAPEERKKGWHIQYKDFNKQSTFIWPEELLFRYDQFEFYPNYLVELVSGIGVNRTK